MKNVGYFRAKDEQGIELTAVYHRLAEHDQADLWTVSTSAKIDGDTEVAGFGRPEAERLRDWLTEQLSAEGR